jgi:hypothetical protein
LDPKNHPSIPGGPTPNLAARTPIIVFMASDSVVPRARRITVRRFASSAEADRHDLEFWLQMPEAERVLHAWRLSQELLQLRGNPPDEPRLHRSVESVRRR